MVSPPIIITKCTDGKHGNYDLIIIILIWNNHYNLNFNVGLSDDSNRKAVHTHSLTHRTTAIPLLLAYSSEGNDNQNA